MTNQIVLLCTSVSHVCVYIYIYSIYINIYIDLHTWRVCVYKYIYIYTYSHLLGRYITPIAPTSFSNISNINNQSAGGSSTWITWRIPHLSTVFLDSEFLLEGNVFLQKRDQLINHQYPLSISKKWFVDLNFWDGLIRVPRILGLVFSP